MSVYVYFASFLFLFVFKVALLVLLIINDGNIFGGGNDANYYHDYALGYDDYAVNVWPIILRHLHDVGLYSRDGVSHFLKFLGFIAIPFLVAKLASLKGYPSHNRVFWMAVVIISAYPTLMYYTTDIYRDVFMIFLWVVGLFVFKALSNKPKFSKTFVIFVLGLFVAYVLFEFRPYLGAGYLAALLFSTFYSFRRYPFLLSICAFFLILFIFFAIGFLEPILAYRAIFSGEMTGGSNLGVTFSSITRFLPDLILTISFQLFGLFIVNISSVIVLLVESLPFMFFLYYVIKNRAFSTVFVDYLIVFFVVYSTIWLLGNDNLGTAVRLRMYSYICIYIAFCVIYQNKKMVLSKQLNRA